MFGKLIPYYVGCSILNDSEKFPESYKEKKYTEFDILYRFVSLVLPPALY